MNKYFIQLFLKENTVILPGFGALVLLNEKHSQIVFLPDLTTDDGKLASYISEIEGIEEQDAQNTIAKFIREIQSNLNKGESFDIFEFGSFSKTENRDIEFTSWMKDKESVSLNEVVEPIKVIATPKKEEKKVLSKEMDSIALIQALLNSDADRAEPAKQTNATENIRQSKEKTNDFKPIVNTTKITENAIFQETEIEKKKKRKFPFWFFFISLFLISASFFICYNFQAIQSKISTFSRHKVTKKEIFANPSTPEVFEKSAEILDTLKEKESQEKENISKENQKIYPKPQVDTNPSDQKDPSSTLPKAPTTPKTNVARLNESILSDQFHVISGAFGPKRLATKKVDSFIKDGFNAHLLPEKIGGLYHVAMGSFASNREATQFLRVQRAKNIRVWLLTLLNQDKLN